MASESRITPDRVVLTGLLLTAAIYCRDLKYDFLLDDIPLILLNPATASWHTLKMIFITDVFFTKAPNIPIAPPALHYRPVFMLWFLLNRLLFGSVLPWWHLTSLLLHLGVTFLVYRLGLRMLREPWAAALAALLFALHPIHAESVSYVSASTDLLVTLFSLIAFLWYARFREERACAAYWTAAILFAALAMFSKETGAMLPWMLLAYEALRQPPPGTRRQWKEFLWTLPFFGVVAVYLVVRTLLLGHNLGPGPGGSRLAALLDTPLVLLAYLRNLLWSFHLSFFYPVEWGTHWTILKGCAVAAVLGAGVLLWKHSRDRPGVRLQLLWTAILFVPPVLAVSAFVKEDWIHDRHMYLVSVPFCLVVAALLTEIKIPRRASIAASSVIVLGLALETAVQVPRFQDGVSIYESAVRVAPRNALAHRYYAFALCSYGHYEEAFREYRITEELRPYDPASYSSYAEALSEVGRDEDAAAEYQRALQLTPGSTPYRAFLLYRLATIRVKKLDARAGEDYMREAIRIAPDAPNYHVILADALRAEGRTQEADQEMLLETSLQKNLAHTAADSQ